MKRVPSFHESRPESPYREPVASVLPIYSPALRIIGSAAIELVVMPHVPVGISDQVVVVICHNGFHGDSRHY